MTNQIGYTRIRKFEADTSILEDSRGNSILNSKGQVGRENGNVEKKRTKKTWYIVSKVRVSTDEREKFQSRFQFYGNSPRYAPRDASSRFKRLACLRFCKSFNSIQFDKFIERA